MKKEKSEKVLDRNLYYSKRRTWALVVLVMFGLCLSSVSYLVASYYNFLNRPEPNNIPCPTVIFERAERYVLEVKAYDGIRQSFGTAVIISSRTGEMLTNAHVVTFGSERTVFENIYVRFSFEEDFRPVTLSRFDPDIDIAVLTFSARPSFQLSSALIETSDEPKAGQRVYAVGNAKNQGISISGGIISVPIIEISYGEIILTTIKSNITITDGNSGGALLNEQGRLIGITTFRLRDNLGNIVHGMAYSMPIGTVMEFVRG
jgi:S1-C subfamily serine protease